MQVYIYIFIILIVRAAAGLQNGIRQKWGQMKSVVHVSRQVRVERVDDKDNDDDEDDDEEEDEDDDEDDAPHSCLNNSENGTITEMKMLKLTSQLERLNTTIVALQYCIDNNDSCQANTTVLETLVTKMETQVTNINACLTDSLCEELRQKDGRHKRSPMHKARHGGSRHNH